MVDDDPIMDDFMDDDLNLPSMHSSDSYGSEGDALEGAESSQSYGNGQETHNNHTNDAMADETTLTMSTSSSLSNLLPSNNNHTSAKMDDTITTTPYSSSS